MIIILSITLSDLTDTVPMLNIITELCHSIFRSCLYYVFFLGAFVPKCDEEGYYEKKQCHASTGYCWCVDKHGNEFLESRVRGDPSCGELHVGNNSNKRSS